MITLVIDLSVVWRPDVTDAAIGRSCNPSDTDALNREQITLALISQHTGTA